MGWFSGIVVYVLIWWVTLFTVLPWRVQPLKTPETGMAAGAPIAANMKMKCIVTTAISAILWICVYVLIEVDIIDYRAIASQMM